MLEWAEQQVLYAVGPGHNVRFPEWQFPDGQRLPKLQLVLRELSPGMHPYSVEGLLAEAPHEELDDMTAVEWLAGGGSVDPIVSIAVSTAYD